jgi:beta-galactosidase beta subunit
MNTKLTIFGFPRSGTKLLASIYEQQGYHNFGEFFNPYSTTITGLDRPLNVDIDDLNGAIPKATRLSFNRQLAIRNRSVNVGKTKDAVLRTRIVEARQTVFNQFADVDPSVVTCWTNDTSFVRDLFGSMSDRFFLCPQRKNKLDQLLSYCITRNNINFDNELPSKPTKIDLSLLDNLYHQLYVTDRMQDKLVSSGKGRYIDFDLLIAGQEDLGFTYNVTSEDQHTDLESLVINIDEVKNRIALIQRTIEIIP